MQHKLGLSPSLVETQRAAGKAVADIEQLSVDIVP
jgi:hypothetical protein